MKTYHSVMLDIVARDLTCCNAAEGYQEDLMEVVPNGKSCQDVKEDMLLTNLRFEYSVCENFNSRNLGREVARSIYKDILQRNIDYPYFEERVGKVLESMG